MGKKKGKQKRDAQRRSNSQTRMTFDIGRDLERSLSEMSDTLRDKFDADINITIGRFRL